MVRWFLISLGVVGLTLVSVRDSAAQIVPGWNTKQFSLERIDADRVRLQREVEIEGEAGSPNAGQKFFADDLQLNIKTGELIASGNVVFQTPTTQIAADSVVFNTKTKMGTFNAALGIASLGERGNENRSMFGTLEPDVYFYGATIEKVGPDKYRISKGWFTTCVQPTPRWEIVSGSATVNLDDYVVLRNAVIQVKDVPVFYLPLLYYPIQEDDRATGFLMPQWGASQAMGGSSIGNAFFWAINRSQDATFFHDWMFSRGNGIGTEYRYMLGPQAQGNVRYYWLDETEAIINGTLRSPRRSNTIQGGLSQNLPFGLSARARVDYFSNVTVQQTYNHDPINATQSNRTIDAGVSGSWRNLSMNGSYRRNEVFYNETDSTLSGAAPGVTASLSGVKVGRLPIFASVNAEAAQVLYVENFGDESFDSGLVKADLFPSIRVPLSTLPYLQVNGTASYRTTYYSESLADDLKTQIEEPITRNYGDMGVQVVGPVFSRVFNPQNAIADRMKHVIEPNFAVQRRTTIENQDHIPTRAGAYDRIVGGTTQMNYGLTNRVLVRKDVAGEQSGAPRELFSVSLRQSYYTDETASQYDNSYSYGYSYRSPNAFSPVSLSLRATPTLPLLMEYRLEYDPVPVNDTSPKLLGMSLNSTWRSEIADISASWTRQAYASVDRTIPPNNYIQSSSNLRFAGNKYGGTVTYNYDIARSTLVTQRYTAFYNPQCCGVAFEYQTFNYANDGRFFMPKDRRFNMSFTLAGVGSFSNFFGAFGGGSY